MEARDRILEAAGELFGARGFARTTIRQIAERASANSALIYYYFGSKGGLLEALVEGIQGLVRDNLERAALEGTPAEKLERFIRLQVDLMRRRAPLARLLVREVINHNEIVLATMRRAVGANLDVVRRLIVEGVESGELRPVDPVRAAQTLMGSILLPVVLAPLVLPPDASDEDDEDDHEALADHVVDLYLNGLRTR